MKNTVLYIFVGFLVVFASCNSSTARDLNIGDTAVDFPEGKRWFDGEAVSLQDNIGKKVTLIYFMKPGCGSCDKFAPHLYRLMLKYKDDLAVVGVTEFTSDKIEEYIQKKKGDYPIMQDMGRAFMNQYIGVINKYPYVAIIGKDGKLAWYGRGKFHSHVTDEIERALATDLEPVDSNFSGDKFALAIGVDHSELLLNTITSPENNAKLVSEAFKGAGYKDVEPLLGSSASKEMVMKGLSKVAEEAKQGDSVVLFFSGEAKPSTPGDGSVQLKLYLSDSTMSVGELVKEFKAHSECDNLFVVIDANIEDSSIKEWEDIAEDVGKGVGGATIMLSAARWDRSRLNEDNDQTIFSEMFADFISNSSSELTPYVLWRSIRDRMSKWSRKDGVLQSPFLENPKDFSIGSSQ